MTGQGANVSEQLRILRAAKEGRLHKEHGRYAIDGEGPPDRKTREWLLHNGLIRWSRSSAERCEITREGESVLLHLPSAARLRVTISGEYDAVPDSGDATDSISMAAEEQAFFQVCPPAAFGAMEVHEVAVEPVGAGQGDETAQEVNPWREYAQAFREALEAVERRVSVPVGPSPVGPEVTYWEVSSLAAQALRATPPPDQPNEGTN